MRDKNGEKGEEPRSGNFFAIIRVFVEVQSVWAQRGRYRSCDRYLETLGNERPFRSFLFLGSITFDRWRPIVEEWISCKCNDSCLSVERCNTYSLDRSVPGSRTSIAMLIQKRKYVLINSSRNYRNRHVRDAIFLAAWLLRFTPWKDVAPLLFLSSFRSSCFFTWHTGAWSLLRS